MDQEFDSNKNRKPKKSILKTVIIIISSILFVMIGLSLSQFGPLIAFVVLIFIGAAFVSVYEVIRMLKDRNHKS